MDLTLNYHDPETCQNQRLERKKMNGIRTRGQKVENKGAEIWDIKRMRRNGGRGEKSKRGVSTSTFVARNDYLPNQRLEG